jgi:hypothetical protein
LFSSQSRNLIFTVLKSTLESVDLFLADIDLVLVSADLELGLLVHFLLRSNEFIHLFAHFFYLLSLGMINIGLTGNLVVAFPNFILCILILATQLLIGVTGLGKLDFDVPERVLEFLIFYLSKAEHLPAFLFGTFVPLDSKAFASI